MRITAYNLLTEGLGAELDKQKATRNAMHDLMQSVDRVHLATHRVARDDSRDAIPGVAPGEATQSVEKGRQGVAMEDAERVAKGRLGHQVALCDARGQRFDAPQSDVEFAKSLGFGVVESAKFVAVEAQHLAVRDQRVVLVLQKFEAREKCVAVQVESRGAAVVVRESKRKPSREQ